MQLALEETSEDKAKEMKEDSVLDIIDHVAITVSDLESSSKWYQTSFNCEEIHSDRSQVVMQFRNIKLSLILPSSQPRHLAFVRQDASSLGEMRQQSDGTRSTLLSDPAGNVIEIIEPQART